MAYKATAEGKVIIRLEDNAAIPVDERNADYRRYQEWLLAGNLPEAADPPPAPARLLTIYAFKMRLTAAERKRLRAASKSNPDVEDLLDLLDSAKYVDLDREDGVVAALPLIVDLLDTPERIDAILNIPIEPHERP